MHDVNDVGEDADAAVEPEAEREWCYDVAHLLVFSFGKAANSRYPDICKVVQTFDCCANIYIVDEV